jgi:hypothetical protein
MPSPKYKIYRVKEYVGSVKYATDAAVLVSVQSDGEVRLEHSFILWREGKDGHAGESYDAAAETILQREAEVHHRSFERSQKRLTGTINK